MSPAVDDAAMQPAAEPRRPKMCWMCRTPIYLGPNNRGGRRCCSPECSEEKRHEERRQALRQRKGC